jgi:hypothetical protein
MRLPLCDVRRRRCETKYYRKTRSALTRFQLAAGSIAALCGREASRDDRHHQEEHRRQREDRWVRWAHLEEQCCEKSRQYHRACEPDRNPERGDGQTSRAVLPGSTNPRPAIRSRVRLRHPPSRMATTSVRSGNCSANVFDDITGTS